MSNRIVGERIAQEAADGKRRLDAEDVGSLERTLRRRKFRDPRDERHPDVSAATLPADSTARKAVPMAAGLLDYFPAALAAVAEVSKAGNDKHNPGEPLHHARGKSMDHADCIIRHLVDRGQRDESGLRHSAMAAWRALALLQEELEADGSPLARGARESSGEIVERKNVVYTTKSIPADQLLEGDALLKWRGSE